MRLHAVLAVATGLASLIGAEIAAAADPPPLGSPIDRFGSRQQIGKEGLLVLGAGSDHRTVGVRRVNVNSSDPRFMLVEGHGLIDEGNEPLGTPDPGVIAGVTEADLAIRQGAADESPRAALEPGIAVAATELGAAARFSCRLKPFCLGYIPSRYDSAHKRIGTGGHVDLDLSSYPEPADGSEISVAAGIFDPAAGPSLAISWVAADQQIYLLQVKPQHHPNGAVSGLQAAGDPMVVGSAHVDPVYGITSPSLAVGDFARLGHDQVGVAWAPSTSSSTGRSVSGATFDVGAAGFEQVNSASSGVIGFVDGSPVQLSPHATARRITAANGSSREQMLIAPAFSKEKEIFVYDPNGIFGLISQGLVSGAAVHSEIHAAGDIDGDGREDLISNPDIRLNTFTNIHVLTKVGAAGTGGAEGFPVYDYVISSAIGEGPGTVATIDARPTGEQRVVPAPSIDEGALPQVAIIRSVTSGGQTRATLALRALDQFGNLFQAGTTGDRNLTEPVPSADYVRPRLTGFALDGRAELGDPKLTQVTSFEPSVVLNAPPTHFDILDGVMYDPNFCYAGNQYEVPEVCFFSSEYERTASASTEVTNTSTEDWAVSAKVEGSVSILGVAEVGAEIRGGYGEQFSKVGGSSVTDTVTVTVKARNTDKIYGIRKAYDLLEYPIYQPGESEPSGYVISATPHTVSRRWIDSSSPQALQLASNHQPGNILSYPENLSTDENPFISPTVGDPRIGPVDTFASDEFELSDFSDYKYELTHSKVTNAGASAEKSWNAGGTVSGSVGVEGVASLKVEVSGDYKSSSLVTSKTEVGDTTKLTSSFGGIDESFGETAYTVKPFSYWTDNGTLVVDYAVEPSLAPTGGAKTWWQLKYGTKPDLTLNLPRLLDYEKQAGISSDAARFISPGVRVLQGSCDAPRTLAPTYGEPGQPLCLRAEVQNYSLKDAPAGTRVEFYDADPDLGGELIASKDALPAIAARESTVVSETWVPDERYAGTEPRIFAVVDTGGDVTEIHEDNQKGFHAYDALESLVPALHAPQDVLAEAGEGRSLSIEWTPEPRMPAIFNWQVSAYPDDGGPPISKLVPGTETSTTIDGLEPGIYRVVVKATDATAGLTASAGAGLSPASHPAEPVELGVTAPGAPTDVSGDPGHKSIELSWEAPADDGGTEITGYRVEEFREPGQSFSEPPVEAQVDGSVHSLKLSGLTNGRPYRFTVRAINGVGEGDPSDPSAAVTPDIQNQPTNVEFTDVPAEGSYTGTSVEIRFETRPAGAETECIVDGISNPCRSPLRLSELESGSHSIQVAASNGETSDSTPLVTWRVDAVEPTVSVDPMQKLTRGPRRMLRFNGDDAGGSELSGFEVRRLAAAGKGAFGAPETISERANGKAGTHLVEVELGETVCNEVRAVDAAGNTSPWTAPTCITRAYDESQLKVRGAWKRIKGKGLTGGRAVQTRQRGPRVTLDIGSVRVVRILAGRCTRCGRLAVEYRGRTRKVIDLSKAFHRKLKVGVINARLPRARFGGRLRLVSRGGGRVRIDGVAVPRKPPTRTTGGGS